MKIKELIKILEKFPPDLEIMVEGYEGGYEDIEDKRMRKLKLKKVDNHENWVGDYEEADLVKNSNPIFEAIILSRKSF